MIARVVAARQRELLIIPAALLIAIGLVVVPVAAGPGHDASPDALQTQDSSSTTSTTTAAATTTSTTEAPTTTVAPVATTAAPATTVARVPTTRAPATTAAPQPPVTQPPPAPSCPGGTAADDVIATKFCEYRINQGLPQVSRNAGLDAAATDWARTWANADAVAGILTISHNPGAGAAVQAVCCPSWSENVAYNSSAGAAWNAWLGSPTHLANLRYPRVGEYGVGVVSANGTTYFVHLFGWH